MALIATSRARASHSAESVVSSRLAAVVLAVKSSTGSCGASCPARKAQRLGLPPGQAPAAGLTKLAGGACPTNLCRRRDQISQDFRIDGWALNNGWRFLIKRLANFPPFFRHPRGKTSIGIAVPQANRHPQFTQRKSPRLSKQSRISQHAFGRRFPSTPLTLETSFKCPFVTQRIGIAWFKQFQEPGATAPRRPQ